jgi:hypothetical protein
MGSCNDDTGRANGQVELESVQAARKAVLRMLRKAESLGLDGEVLRTQLNHLEAAATAFKARDMEAGRTHVRLALGE